MKTKSLTNALAASAALFLFSSTGSATALLGVYEGSDCSGTFGQGFENCVAPAFDGYDRSPVIAKYDLDEDLWTFNTAVFPGIDETAWNITIDAPDGKTGSFVYTLLNNNFPAITSFVVKAGNGFAWFGPVGAPVNNVQTGSWDISGLSLPATLPPTDPKCTRNNPAKECSPMALGGFSHITFYDNGDQYQMPEPAALALLGIGLVGAGFARRRKSA